MLLSCLYTSCLYVSWSHPPIARQPTSKASSIAQPAMFLKTLHENLLRMKVRVARKIIFASIFAIYPTVYVFWCYKMNELWVLTHSLYTFTLLLSFLPFFIHPSIYSLPTTDWLTFSPPPSPSQFKNNLRFLHPEVFHPSTRRYDGTSSSSSSPSIDSVLNLFFTLLYLSTLIFSKPLLFVWRKSTNWMSTTLTTAYRMCWRTFEIVDNPYHNDNHKSMKASWHTLFPIYFSYSQSKRMSCECLIVPCLLNHSKQGSSFKGLTVSQLVIQSIYQARRVQTIATFVQQKNFSKLLSFLED